MIALHSSSYRAILFWLVVCAAVGPWAHAETPARPLDYQPGRGWQLPGTGLSLGGYASAGIRDLRDTTAEFAVDDFSLFVHWEDEGKLRFFSELDLEDPFAYRPARGKLSSRSYLALERLYVDYLYSDRFSVRAGKFLTPVGRWNTIHADPLVWTSSRPLVTEESFPTNVTGAMLFGTVPVLGKSFDYSIYSALSQDWRPDPKLDPFEEAYGVHVGTAIGSSAELGVSLVSFEQRNARGERRKLLGADYFWSRDRFELSAEATCRFSERGNAFEERGLFFQAVAPLTERLYAVGRYEFYDQAGPGPALNLWLAGVAMKLSPALVLKAEYRSASRTQPLAPSGAQASVALLF